MFNYICKIKFQDITFCHNFVSLCFLNLFFVFSCFSFVLLIKMFCNYYNQNVTISQHHLTTF